MANDIKLANPAALGLGGFALTTFVLNVHNAGIIDIGAALPLGLFYGGLAQLVAGFLEFRTGNTFGMTAFCSYGAFWIALASMVIMQMNKWIPAEASKGWLLTTLVAWTVFTFVLWIGSFKHNKALIWVFTTLLILFILLDINVWKPDLHIGKIAGWEGIFCAGTAWYLMAAIILNDSYGRTVLPIGPIHK
ncbi:MAG TPA: acetate uptake transporter [Candidatus Binatia bacterium]|nr:acetate uptake transporter [Candidatus Binatia bacterium]